MKQETPQEEWLEKTSLLTDVLVDHVLTERGIQPTTFQPDDWFYTHVNRRLRYLHANNPKWRRWLENRDPRIDPRMQCWVWIRHWLDAYQFNPERYREKHEQS